MSNVRSLLYTGKQMTPRPDLKYGMRKYSENFLPQFSFCTRKHSNYLEKEPATFLTKRNSLAVFVLESFKCGFVY